MWILKLSLSFWSAFRCIIRMNPWRNLLKFQFINGSPREVLSIQSSNGNIYPMHTNPWQSIYMWGRLSKECVFPLTGFGCTNQSIYRNRPTSTMVISYTKGSNRESRKIYWGRVHKWNLSATLQESPNSEFYIWSPPMFVSVFILRIESLEKAIFPLTSILPYSLARESITIPQDLHVSHISSTPK